MPLPKYPGKYYWPLERRRRATEIGFERMGKYLDIIRPTLQDQQAQVLGEFDRFSKSSAEISGAYENDKEYRDYMEDSRQQAGESLGGKLDEITSEVPRLIYNSFIFIWYSFVEHELNQLCKEFNLKIEVTFDDSVTDDGIFKARRFLQESFMKYTIDSSDWQELDDVRKIRNKLTHAGASIPHSSKQSKEFSHYSIDGNTIYVDRQKMDLQYLKKHDMISGSYNEGFQLDLSHEYCEHLIRFGKEFFDRMYFALNDRYFDVSQDAKY